MSSLYEILGVEPQATIEELKRAFRRKAKVAHPDRHGGDDSAMAAINRAYDVLSDPERRQAYDERGEEAFASPLEELVRGALMEAFADALNADVEGDVVGHARSFLMRRMNAQEQKIAELRRHTVRIIKLRESVVANKGVPNHFHTLIDTSLEKLAPELVRLEKMIEVHAHAIEQLEGYTSLDQGLVAQRAQRLAFPWGASV